jgi:hypothetical protein
MAGRLSVRLAALVVAVTASLAFATSSALAAPGVIQDIAGCHTHRLPAGDDNSSAAVPLGFTAHMFDSSFSSVFVNNNGNLTTDRSLSEFTPFDFRETGTPFIAPFFGDVDTSLEGGIGHVDYGPITFDGKAAFCVIWDHVGYFDEHEDKRNTFQVIIVNQGTPGVDLVFNYDSIAWETGDASDGVNGFGGTSAAAGWAAGDGDSSHALMQPGSFANGGLLDSNPQTSLAGHATAGQPAGRYVYQLREGAPTGGRIIGQVTDPGGDPVSGAAVQICPMTGGGSCVTRIADTDGNYRASNLPVGHYRLTGFPGPDSNNSSASVDNVNVPAIGSTTTQDIELGPAPQPPPDGTTIGPRIDDDPEDGVPSAYWGDPLHLATQGCPGGSASYTMELEGRIVRSGAMTESPAGSGSYVVDIAPLQPNHGVGEIRVHFTCPGGPADDVDFGIYIDPSGVVVDPAGNPVPDAQVTLYRSASQQGPFFSVPRDSAVMSPDNRRNPDRTDDNGHFGWDVVAGFYVVRAETDDGCTAQSPVLSIPPPVTDAVLRLTCPPAPPPPAPPVVLPTQNPPVATPARTLASLGKVKLKGKTLAVKVKCAAAAKSSCGGKVAVRIGKKKVGSRSFLGLKPGKTATVKVKLNKKGRKLVKKVKRGKKVKFKLRITVRDAAGAGKTVSKTVKIKR